MCQAYIAATGGKICEDSLLIHIQQFRHDEDEECKASDQVPAVHIKKCIDAHDCEEAREFEEELYRLDRDLTPVIHMTLYGGHRRDKHALRILIDDKSQL